MNHLMIDLETMSTANNAAIISIGAVFFEPTTGELGETFYCNVDLADCQQKGLSIDADTIMWWMKRDEQVRAAFSKESHQLHSALNTLLGFIISRATPRTLQVWGNGASFDNVILRNAYAAAGATLPWDYYNDRDVRTIVEIGRSLGINPKKDIPLEGTAHNALDDAIHQARYVSQIWQQIGLVDKEEKRPAAV